MVDTMILDSCGDKNSVRPTISRVADDEWLVNFTPVMDGLHFVHVYFAGKPIPISPASVYVSPSEINFLLLYGLSTDVI